MEKIGIFFGSTTGNTESVAEKLQELFGSDNADLINVDGASVSDLDAYKNLIFGTSTWGLGDLQDDFEGFVGDLSNANLAGKTVALYGLGDSASYPDTFVDGMSEIYKAVDGKCNIVGSVSVEGYEFDESAAVVDDVFVGLALDEDNESDKMDDRLSAWVEILKSELQ